MSPEEARRLALRDLGGLTQTTESIRDVRTTWLDGVWGDVRYAVRVLRRAPRFTLTALTLLVLGIGSTTAIFSIAYAVLVRPLPYPDAERLVFVAEKEGTGVIWPNFEDWRHRATSFDGLASSLADAVTVTSGDVPRRFESRSVTSTFFRVLGVSPFRGRLFDDADARPDAAATAVISRAFWMRELGGDDAAVGRTISFLSRKPFTVIGVMPPGFRYLTPADVYLLLEPQVAANYRGMQSRNTRTNLYAVGRLKPGVTVAAARTEMQTIAAALDLEYGNIAVARTGGPVSSASIESAFHDLDRTVPVFNDRTVDRVMREASSRRRIAMIVLSVFGSVAVLLAAIGLYGVIAQGVAERRQEIGVRMALGATGGQVVRLFLRHGLVVVIVGIGCGVVAAVAAARSLASLVFGVTVTDPVTLGTVAALLTVVTLLAGYMPTRSATRIDPSTALRAE